MKVLFIGGTGTISHGCARRCMELGIDLWLLLRGTRDSRLPSNAKVLHGDIKKDPRRVRDMLAEHSWDCVVDWVVYDKEDVRRDIEIFGGRTKRFIYVSSTAVYSKPFQAPMVDETGKLFGVISVTDILQHHAADLDPDSDTVASIGTAGAITIDTKASVHEAAKLMAKSRVRRLVVLDGDEVVGLFSATDVVALVARLDSENVNQWSLEDYEGC